MRFERISNLALKSSQACSWTGRRASLRCCCSGAPVCYCVPECLWTPVWRDCWRFVVLESLGMGNLTAVDFVIFTPCGMLATILPVSPVGLGVGQVAFLSLFRLAGSEQGANLFSLYTLTVLVTSIFGGVFYLSNKRKK